MSELSSVAQPKKEIQKPGPNLKPTNILALRKEITQKSLN